MIIHVKPNTMFFKSVTTLCNTYIHKHKVACELCWCYRLSGQLGRVVKALDLNQQYSLKAI